MKWIIRKHHGKVTPLLVGFDKTKRQGKDKGRQGDGSFVLENSAICNEILQKQIK